MAFKRSWVRFPLSPPVSSEFEHHKDGLHFRQRCCGLCGIQVTKKATDLPLLFSITLIMEFL